MEIIDIITKLKSFSRFDIDSVDNGEFIEQIERVESEGQFVLAEDIDSLIELLKEHL